MIAVVALVGCGTIQKGPRAATMYNDIGADHHLKGEFEKALELYQKSLNMRLKLLGSNHPDVASSYANLGALYKDKGEYDKAVEYSLKALAINLKELGPEHPNLSVSYHNLGLAYKEMDQYDKSLEYHHKALAIDLKNYGPNHPFVADSYGGIGSAWRGKKDMAKAKEFIGKAYAILLNQLGPNHSDTRKAKAELDALHYKEVPAIDAGKIEAAIRMELNKRTGELTKADLEKVTELYLNDNQLTELPKGLEKLTQLKYLYFQRNQLTDVKGLEKLTKLEALWLENNKLTDVKGLENLTKLKGLNLKDNPDLTKAQIDELKKALPNCRIFSNPKK